MGALEQRLEQVNEEMANIKREIEATDIYVKAGTIAKRCHNQKIEKFSDEDNTYFVYKYKSPSWISQPKLSINFWLTFNKEDKTPISNSVYIYSKGEEVFFTEEKDRQEELIIHNYKPSDWKETIWGKLLQKKYKEIEG